MPAFAGMTEEVGKSTVTLRVPPPPSGEDQSAIVSNSQSWKMRTARLDSPVRREANQ